MRATLLAALMLATCTAATIEPTAMRTGDLVALRAEVREIARPACGRCHTGTLPTAKPEALAVFDFDHDNWPKPMDAGQLEFFLERIDNDVSADQRATVEGMLRGELALRAPQQPAASPRREHP